MDGQLSFQCILESHLGLGCWPRYCLMLRSQGMNWKSYLLKRKRRPTSPSSGQAAISSQLRHPNLLACHSRAALNQAATRQIQQPKTITKLSIVASSIPLKIQLPALQRCQLNTSYTPFEAVRAMEQALLPTIGANRKGYLKN